MRTIRQIVDNIPKPIDILGALDQTEAAIGEPTRINL